MFKEINKKIEEMKKKLYKAIDKTGLNSPETSKISKEIDNEINKYYSMNSMYTAYLNSMEHLEKITKDFGEFPTTKAWNKYATENVLLSNVTIEYMSGLNWNNLRKKVFAEIRKKFF